MKPSWSVFLSGKSSEDLRPVLEDLPQLLLRLEISSEFLGLTEGEILPSEVQLDISGAESSEALNPSSSLSSTLYFQSEESAAKFCKYVSAEHPNLLVKWEEDEQIDWNIKWKEKFAGLFVDPCWDIQPAWNPRPTPKDRERILVSPGMGFGSGTHPTTQLCLEAIGQAPILKGKRVFDFGTGSGILSVALARKGADVVASEIDEDAVLAAQETFRLNEVENKIKLVREFVYSELPFDIIVANIVLSVLCEFADSMVKQLIVGGEIWVSGILHNQLSELKENFSNAFRRCNRDVQYESRSKNEWEFLKIKS